jgi:hypothetical protein
MVMLYIAIFLAAFLTGYLLAWLSRDELVYGRKWFMLLIVVSLISLAGILFMEFPFKIPSVLALFFLLIISLIAIWKSYDKEWIKN